MASMRKLGTLTSALILCPYILAASTTIWNGLGSNCDLLSSGNWNGGLPNSGSVAQFNSTVTNICLSPTSSDGFSVSTFDFTNSASDFSFTINTNTTPLTFNGLGSITGTNNPTITLNNTNTSNTLTNQLLFSNATANSTGGGVLTLNNVGTLSSGSSASSGYLIDNQLYAPNTLTIPDGANIVMVNSGTNNSTGSGNNIGVNAQQLFAHNAATIGSNVSINLSSLGYDNSANGGGNNVGNSDYQFYIQNGPIMVGDHVTITLSNAGHFAAGGGNTAGTEQIAYIGESQFDTEAFVTAGNNFTLNGSNFGEDHSNSSSYRYVGVVEGEAIYFEGGAMFGTNAILSHNNQGVATGNYTNHGTTTGYLSSAYYFDGPLTAGDNFSMSSVNMGTDSGQGYGSNEVAYIDEYQIALNYPVQLGDNATFTMSNTGISTSSASNGGYVGYVGDYQFYTDDTFFAGDNFTLVASNYGEDHSTGGNDIGYVDASYAVEFVYGATFGSNANLTHTNTGIASGTFTINGGKVGFVNSQFYFNEALIAEDHFTLTATNTGTDSTENSVFAYVGILDDDPQFYGETTVQLGNDATFTLSNSGTCTGNSGNGVGAVYEDQWYVSDSFTAGSGLTISVSNEGTSSSSSAQVGFVQGAQFDQHGPFSAGENLNLRVTNSGTGLGQVGYVDGSQIYFANTCTLNDGTSIYASNTGVGYINGPQIDFVMGFDLTGSATIEAYNSGTVAGGIGISVQAGSGGDAQIILNNNQLSITSPATTFTIGSLTGNTNSSVVSTPALIIDTDAGVTGSFAGNISSIVGGTLLKSGPGTQLLSGVNTFTGLTTVGDGILVLDGSLAGPLTIDAAGTLEGTGSVGGLVTNYGLISPGNSIGTIHFNSGFDNLGGGYLVEVTGAPASDLIDVVGIADIEGGLVTVATADGTYAFRHKYTILTASTEVVGSYTDAIALNPLIVPTLSQDFNNIYLYLTTDISAAATTCNQTGVANALDSILVYTPELNDLISALVDLPLSGVEVALDDLSGYQHSSDLFTTLAINRQFVRRLYDPLRNIVTDPCCRVVPCTTTFTPWIEGGGIFTNLDSRRHNHNGFNTTGYEVTAGVHTTFNQNWTLGVAGSYEHDSLRFRRGRGCGDSNTWFAGLYGLYRPNCYYGLFDFAYGHSSNNLERHFSVGDLFYKARSKPEVSEFTFYGEAGIDFMVTNILIQPFIGFEAGAFWRDRVREGAAGGVELDIKEHNQAVGTSRLGLHLTSQNYGLDVSFDVAWNYRYTNSQHLLNERFVEFGPTFSLCNGYEIDRNSVDYALTLSTCIDCNWNAYIEGSGESWSHSQTYGILAGVAYTW